MYSDDIWNGSELQRKNENSFSIYNECILTLFETIWNCRHFFFLNNVSKACTLTVFEKIGSCRNLLKTISLIHAFWYLKRIGTAEKN